MTLQERLRENAKLRFTQRDDCLEAADELDARDATIAELRRESDTLGQGARRIAHALELHGLDDEHDCGSLDEMIACVLDDYAELRGKVERVIEDNEREAEKLAARGPGYMLAADAYGGTALRLRAALTAPPTGSPTLPEGSGGSSTREDEPCFRERSSHEAAQPRATEPDGAQVNAAFGIARLSLPPPLQCAIEGLEEPERAEARLTAAERARTDNPGTGARNEARQPGTSAERQAPDDRERLGGAGANPAGSGEPSKEPARAEGEKCRVCDGTGRNPLSDMTHWLPCTRCNGTGKEPKEGA